MRDDYLYLNSTNEFIYITPIDLKLIIWQDWVMWKYKGLFLFLLKQNTNREILSCQRIYCKSSMKYSQLVCFIKSRQTGNCKWAREIGKNNLLCHWDKSTTAGRRRWETNSSSFPFLHIYMAFLLAFWRFQKFLGKGEEPCLQGLMCFLLSNLLVLCTFPKKKLGNII